MLFLYFILLKYGMENALKIIDNFRFDKIKAKRLKNDLQFS